MDTIDNNGSHLPARLPSTSSHLPAMSAPNRTSFDLAPAAPAIQISPQGVLRGLVRNWWRILLLWAVVTAPLLYVIFISFGPTYEATSVISAAPTHLNLYGPVGTAAQTQPIERFIETQITSIMTNEMLGRAIADPAIGSLPFFRDSTDKLTDLRQKLRVVGLEKAAVIRVSFESADPVEAAAIVNAVVGEYMSSYKEQTLEKYGKKIDRIKKYLDSLQEQKLAKISQLQLLVDNGNVSGKSAGGREDEPSSTGGTGEGAADTKKDDGKPNRPAGIDKYSIEQYRGFKAEILKEELETAELRDILESRMAETPDQEPEAAEPSQAFLNAQREARVKELFLRDPAVAQLIADIADTDDALRHAKGVARKAVDPARRAAEKQKIQLTARYEKLWEDRYDHILQQVTMEEATAATAAGSNASATSALPLDVLKAKVKRAERHLESLRNAVAQMDIAISETESDVYAAEVLKADVETLAQQINHINQKYEDLKFAGGNSGTEGVDVILADRAIAPLSPTSNKRIKFMILAPGMVLCLVVGLFVLLEVKAERVADPDSLSTRVQSEVYSLPPLPMVRASNRLAGPGEDDQIDRFIQRLDHLRFALCGDHPDVGLGRCVLITSAIGGEGKTTLAAQLAARCGHAGHSTLLIDADLRRGSLCPLLDVPEGLGLSDVLKEEANAEDVVIPVQGGTFHLLCAGTPVSDTSRIFQGRNFGMLIARLRQSYDLIIIDSPPVLPVPDGLILGRWTDGAVLASRYDVSRAPQVERARRQLNNAGIPVLGTVINGMKTADSYYGRYSYSRGRSGTSDSNGSLES